MSRERRRIYRTFPLWQDLALSTLAVALGIGLFMTWMRCHGVLSVRHPGRNVHAGTREMTTSDQAPMTPLTGAIGGGVVRFAAVRFQT